MKTDPAAIAAQLHEKLLRRAGAFAPRLTAAQIDRVADHELSVGHHRLAERLAQLAADMRGAP